MTVWQLDGREIRALEGQGGEPFAHFMDRLIRAHGLAFGIPQSAIVCQIRTNIADGGVDTRVDAPATEGRIGWLKARTLWQYKAMRPTKADLTAECQKSEVLRLVGEGYAYRLATTEDLTPEKTADLEAHIDACFKSDNTAAPPARILAAADIAAWASFFPPMVAEFRQMPAGLLHLEQWSRRAVVTLTPEYVTVQGWDGYAVTIRAFCDFAREIPNPCLHVLGEAGVGKTRFLHAVLSEITGIAGLMVYVENADLGCEFVAQLVDAADGRAIIVIDECTTEQYRAVQRLVANHGERVRCICLNNTGIRSPSVTGEIWLEKIPVDTVAEILNRNFPNVPQDRRRTYASLSEGYVRLAADMCRHHSWIAPGDLTPVLGDIRDYVLSRVCNDSDRDILLALSLFPRVGARGDMQSELQSMCKLLDLRTQAFHDAAQRLKDSPGFIAVAGRYYYLTPLIVARSLFEQAWERWIAPDMVGFVSNLPHELRERFLTHIGRAASEEVRRQVAAEFRAWAVSFSSEMFAEPAQTMLFIGLCETYPAEFLPLLRAKIETADEPALFAMRKEYGSPDPRRELVWLAERLALFAEHYEDVEAILFRLAECEDESYGNNATGIWRQLHRIWLSGTSKPFDERMDILAERLAAHSNQEQFNLALSGLAEVFVTHYSRMGSPDTVAGRIPPEDWRPQTYGEEADCWSTGMQLLQTIIDDPDTTRREAAIGLALRSCSTFLRKGLLPECKTLFASVLDREAISVSVLQVGEELLDRVDRVDDDIIPEQYRSELEAWLEELRPSSFAGRLRRLVSGNPWHQRMVTHDGEVRPEARELARYALERPDEFEQSLPWLLTDEAASAYQWGYLLATEGGDDALFCRILKETATAKNAGLARGYLSGLRSLGRPVTQEALAELDRLVTAAPMLAFEILVAGGDAVEGLRRVLEMVDSGLVPRSHLMGIAHLLWERPLEIDEIEAVLDRLIDPDDADIEGAVAAGLQLLHFLLHSKKNKQHVEFLAAESTRGKVWVLLDNYLKSDRAADSYEVEELLEAIRPYDVERVVLFLVQALEAHKYELKDKAVELLSQIAGDYPELVWKHFNSALLSNKHYAFQHVPFKMVISAIQEKLILEWLAVHGLKGARRIACHLPAPFVNESGSPVVPSLTDHVLREYADDKQVMAAFFVGVHGTEFWCGNAAERFRAEAEQAKKFLTHDNPGIRKWAESEVRSRLDMAERQQREHEERFLD